MHGHGVQSLSSIRFIKVSAWEEEFHSRIAGLRSTELQQLRTYLLVNQFSSLLWQALPLLVSLTTFSAYALAGNTLTASRIFTSLSLMGVLRFPMAMLPNVINNLVEASVSLRRLQVFLTAAEVDKRAVKRLAAAPHGDPMLHAAFGGSGGTDGADNQAHAGSPSAAAASGLSGGQRAAITVKRGRFKWPAAAPLPLEVKSKGRCCGGRSGGAAKGKGKDGDQRSLLSTGGAGAGVEGAGRGKGGDGGELRGVELTEAGAAGPSAGANGAAVEGVLRDIELNIRRGELVCVVGQVASGKTSLLHALLGEMEKEAGACMRVCVCVYARCVVRGAAGGRSPRVCVCVCHPPRWCRHPCVHMTTT